MGRLSTVKFLIVATSPIEAASETLKKIQIFLQKVSYFENLQSSRMATFQICHEPTLFSYLIKRTMTRCLLRRPAASYANCPNRAHAI